MKALSLFTGIGGFDRAAHRLGWNVVAFCERDPFCQAVLRHHWPQVKTYRDIKLMPGRRYAGAADLIFGGYPCQPYSQAGERRGASDDRALWPHMFRLIDTIRPRWFIGENVAGHVSLGLDQVLSDLESLGYTCQAFVIPACAVDACHRRDRVWIIAHTNHQPPAQGALQPGRAAIDGRPDGSDTDAASLWGQVSPVGGFPAVAQPAGPGSAGPDPDTGVGGSARPVNAGEREACAEHLGLSADAADPDGLRESQPEGISDERRRRPCRRREEVIAYAHELRSQRARAQGQVPEPAPDGQAAADANRQQRGSAPVAVRTEDEHGTQPADSDSPTLNPDGQRRQEQRAQREPGSESLAAWGPAAFWGRRPLKSRVRRVDDGLSQRLDRSSVWPVPPTVPKRQTIRNYQARLRALGNALHSEVAYQIFDKIEAVRRVYAATEHA